MNLQVAQPGMAVLKDCIEDLVIFDTRRVTYKCEKKHAVFKPNTGRKILTLYFYLDLDFNILK